MNTALASVHPAPATVSLTTDGVDDPGTAHFAGSHRSKRLLSPVSLFVLMALGLVRRLPRLRPGLGRLHRHHRTAHLRPDPARRSWGRESRRWSASSASSSRSFRCPRCATSGPVLFYVGLAIFAAVGLVIAGAIMGAVV
jgi:hypothetical protein